MTTDLLMSRLAANPWLSHTVAVAAVWPEVDGVATYRLRPIDPSSAQAYHFRPGQFNMLYVPGCGEVAISLSGDPGQSGELLHTIRVVGRVTEAIAVLGVGGTFGLRGPYGSGWPVEECLGRDVVLIAGGIGLAPLRPVIYSIISRREAFGRVVLLYGARTPETILYAHQFQDWQRKGLEIIVTVDRADSDWTGNVGVVPLLLDRLEPFAADQTIVLTCGPEVMMDFTIRSAVRRGMSRERIWLSMERNMQCAVGLCGHCQLGPAFVCRQGPVFRLDAIEPYLHLRDL